MKNHLIYVLFLTTACSTYNTPELPDLNTPSFSYDSVMKQQQELQQYTAPIRKEFEKNCSQ